MTVTRRSCCPQRRAFIIGSFELKPSHRLRVCDRARVEQRRVDPPQYSFAVLGTGYSGENFRPIANAPKKRVA